MKLLIIGFDGATFNLIRPWAEQGYLPNLARLMAGGVHGDLTSTLPPVTSPAWPTFVTGCNPGKHGVFDFIQPHGAHFTLVNSTQIKQPTIWQRLSQLNYHIGVMNVPVTYPPQPVNGFQIGCLLTPKGAEASYPAGLIARYEAQLGPYRIVPNVQYKPGNEIEFRDDLYDLIHTRGKWALHLIEHEPWDAFMVHFLAMDLMKHALWRFMDHTHPRHEASPYEHAIRDGYALVDEYIGRLMAKLPPDAGVMVMSDHGFGPLRNMVNLNVFFMQKGLLKLKRDPWTQLKAFAFRYGLTPSAAYQWIARLGLQNVIARVSKNTRNNIVGKFLSFENVDWNRTIAYSMGHVGQVYLNLAGREPQGIIPPAQYEQRLQEVMAVLHELRDDDGRPILSQLIRGDQTYQGPYAHKGADLHLILDDYNMIACPLFATEGKVMTHQIRGDSGCHRSEGIFIAYGPGIKQGVTLPAHSIMDLAPTIMHLLGAPVPTEMDGRVLSDIFTHPTPVTYSADNAPATAVSGQQYDADESAQVEERLRSLGYL